MREPRAGKAHIWKDVPHIGPVMVKGAVAGGGQVELYDMSRDEFFVVQASEYAACTNITCLDEALRVTDPEEWERQLSIWTRAWERCGVSRD